MFQIHSPQTLNPAAPPFHHHHHHHHRRRLPPISSSLTSVTNPSNKNPSIQSLCKKGHLKQAIELLSHEQNPSQHTYELLLKSCAQYKSISDAFLVHGNLIDNGFDQDPFLATKLIDMYFELDTIKHVRQVFDETTQRTIYVWNAFFRALSLSGHGEEVLDWYRRMNCVGVPSDRFTYTYALKACVVSEGEASLLWRGREIHAHIL